jgi:hypothetical protein
VYYLPPQTPSQSPANATAFLPNEIKGFMTFTLSSTISHFSHFFLSFFAFALVLIKGRSTLRLVMNTNTITKSTSNATARQLVQSLTPFKGSNTFGLFQGRTYAVYSYGFHFPLFAFKEGQWYRNSDKYSRTTSKHQTLLQPLAGEKMTSMPTENLIALINA